uniref:Uncharacterized protein n=1 Tax=Schistocephalus solidus TaxID=70667 RepID=A0A0X3P7K0_SCHSO
MIRKQKLAVSRMNVNKVYEVLDGYASVLVFSEKQSGILAGSKSTQKPCSVKFLRVKYRKNKHESNLTMSNDCSCKYVGKSTGNTTQKHKWVVRSDKLISQMTIYAPEVGHELDFEVKTRKQLLAAGKAVSKRLNMRVSD